MTDSDSVARLIWILLVLMMVLSSLMARRVPLAWLVAWSLGWVALFFGAYLLFAMMEPHVAAWKQSRREGEVQIVRQPSPTLSGSAAGATVTVPLSEDGHYWVEATANGQPVRFLIDSGASITGISEDMAARLGVVDDPMGTTMTMQTANGSVTARRAILATMRIGKIEATDLPVAVSASLGEVNVLGMNFLGKLKSWRVEDGAMILQAR